MIIPTMWVRNSSPSEPQIFQNQLARLFLTEMLAATGMAIQIMIIKIVIIT